MNHSSENWPTSVRVLPLVTTLLALCSACGPSLDVLHDPGTGGAAGAGGGGSSSLGGSASGAAGSDSSLGGASGGAGTTGVSVCGAVSASEILNLTMGEPCRDQDICEPGACAGMAGPAETNTAAFAACRAHQVQVVTMTLLDVPPGGAYAALDDGKSWADCDSALASGLTGEICEFPFKTCVRPSTDSCCIEGAECWSTDSSASSGRLRRIRICAPGCGSFHPDPAAPVVTDCASAAAADTCHETPGCQGNFVCKNSLFAPGITDFSETNDLNSVLWCAGGSLVGGYGLTWGL